jgi:ankyrin repeat protein
MNGQTKIDMILLLLKNGATINLTYTDSDGDSYFALYVACILFVQEDKNININKDAKKIIDILIQNGADINHCNNDKVTALCCAILFNKIELVELLVSKYSATICDTSLLFASSDDNIYKNNNIIDYLNVYKLYK